MAGLEAACVRAPRVAQFPVLGDAGDAAAAGAARWPGPQQSRVRSRGRETDSASVSGPAGTARSPQGHELADSAYLLRNLRQAQKGGIRVGPIERRGSGEAGDVKVLPLRMTAAEVESLDEAWRRLEFKSRTAMIRAAIAAILDRPRSGD